MAPCKWGSSCHLPVACSHVPCCVCWTTREAAVHHTFDSSLAGTWAATNLRPCQSRLATCKWRATCELSVACSHVPCVVCWPSMETDMHDAFDFSLPGPWVTTRLRPCQRRLATCKWGATCELTVACIHVPCVVCWPSTEADMHDAVDSSLAGTCTTIRSRPCQSHLATCK